MYVLDRLSFMLVVLLQQLSFCAVTQSSELLCWYNKGRAAWLHGLEWLPVDFACTCMWTEWAHLHNGLHVSCFTIHSQQSSVAVQVWFQSIFPVEIRHVFHFLSHLMSCVQFNTACRMQIVWEKERGVAKCCPGLSAVKNTEG